MDRVANSFKCKQPYPPQNGVKTFEKPLKNDKAMPAARAKRPHSRELRSVSKSPSLCSAPQNQT
jgi:hypothetical protein